MITASQVFAASETQSMIRNERHIGNHNPVFQLLKHTFEVFTVFQVETCNARPVHGIPTTRIRNLNFYFGS